MVPFWKKSSIYSTTTTKTITTTQTVTISIVTTAAAAAIATTYLLTKPLISKYGLSGTVRLIWEGDHLPPHIRECVDKLQDIEMKLKKEKRSMNRIKVVIETAKLNSVDHDDENEHIMMLNNIQKDSEMQIGGGENDNSGSGSGSGSASFRRCSSR